MGAGACECVHVCVHREIIHGRIRQSPPFGMFTYMFSLRKSHCSALLRYLIAKISLCSPVVTVLFPRIGRAVAQYRIDRVDASLQNAALSGFDGE